MKKFIIMFLIIALAALGGGYYLKQRQTQEEADETLVLEEGQSLEYVKITSIAGNEMTYTVMEEQTVSAEENARGNRNRRGGRGENDGDMPQGQNADNNSTSSAGISDMGGGMPDTGEGGFGGGSGMSNAGEGGFGGGGMPDAGDMSAGGSFDRNARDSQGSPDALTPEGNFETAVTYVETQQTGQLQIPVGTEVITKLGTSTTFSRLANGDVIQLLLQSNGRGSDEILKIWIVE